MRCTIRENPSKDDESWVFTVPQEAFRVKTRSNTNRTVIYGKFVKFTPEAITFEMAQFPNNRILQGDDPSQFILASFVGLRFPDSGPKTNRDYINRLLKAGLFLNNTQYRFYHHSNSQLRDRSCFLRKAVTDAELDARIYRLGEFDKMMNVAKRAKRIGLLFSAAEIDYHLDPRYTKDIPDIKFGDELFSDGCGLISRRLAVQISKAKRIMFRDSRYTPCVYQIRYLGYKGVLMLHPSMDKEDKACLIQFRPSMKKFSTDISQTFSVVDYSEPYAFGRLNNDIIVLLSSLGITNEKLLSKQEAYFQWIAEASHNLTHAVDFLSCLGENALVEDVLLKGLDDRAVSNRVRSLQLGEIAKFRKNDKPRARMIVHKSRLLFGVCDPFRVLREGEVFIRITFGRRGAATPIHGDVLVVRNPCLHPGDCLKLRAVDNSQLSHLVDCIVFATVAKPGHQAAPAMSSGGDLDGDKFFVCWDPDLVPVRVAESYDYPPNKERLSREVTRADLANHFASYNSSGLAKVADLHGKWARYSREGALCSQCQELNALHSQSVDGANIRIPEKLLTPPQSTEPYILDLLATAAQEFAITFTSSSGNRENLADVSLEDGKNLILQLLRSGQNSVSEYELFNIALRLAQKYHLDFRPYLVHLDPGAMSAAEKEAIVALNKWSGGGQSEQETNQNSLTPEDHSYMWNSLVRSDILTPDDLYQKDLNRPYHIQRLYSSKIHGLATFFEYLQIAMQDFTRKLLVMKTDDRFAVGIFMRGNIPWDEDPEVSMNVVVCPFMSHSSLKLATYKPCTEGYRLHCGSGTFQLYNKNRVDTFVFINRPPATSDAKLTTSIALQKISQRVQKQVGRVNKTSVAAVELHVISNRDRVAHQLFDLWFEHVPTEAFIKRSAREIVSYERNNLRDVDWAAHPDWLKNIFVREQGADSLEVRLSRMTPDQYDTILDFSLEYHAENELFSAFRAILADGPIRREAVIRWMEREPQLVFALLKKFPPDTACSLPEETAPLAPYIVKNIIRSANKLGIASLVALEKISASIARIPVEEYFKILTLASLSVRAPQLAQEVLLVLNESRADAIAKSSASRYAHKHALAVAFDLAEEAADECPCDEDGKPKKQKNAPMIVKLDPDPEGLHRVKAFVRIDLKTSVRLHSHVRLQAASKPEKEWVEAPVMDGLVIQATKGELMIELLHPAPPEMSRMDWKMYSAGIVATSQAMMDAILRLEQDGASCCHFCSLLTDLPDESQVELSDRIQVGEFSQDTEEVGTEEVGPSDREGNLRGTEEHLNPSQVKAIRACDAPLSLVWGPPGTGKTETVVHILRKIVLSVADDVKILMTASTHNAVDNVLKRFVDLNKKEKLLGEEKILRVATDHSKVNKSLQHFTIDARVGGDMNENNRLFKQAQQRVNSAVLVFTTCAGSGLGILRKVDFDVVLIDEASQVTEPCALIPLVKGCQRAIMVGDHVQLRPTVGKMGKALEYDVSLLERLYTGGKNLRIPRTMLNMQYRFPSELAVFPSQEFYEGKLQTGLRNSEEVLRPLSRLAFPWPKKDNVVVPTVFVQCSSDEDMGGQSKSNTGQAELVARLIPMLTGVKDQENGPTTPLKVTVLSPYTKQLKTLQGLLPSSVDAFTIDSFQGRESDIIIFTTVRCNDTNDVGFLEDKRRLNVVWTRAKLALIIVGDRRTMTSSSELWKRAIGSCTEVEISSPASP